MFAFKGTGWIQDPPSIKDYTKTHSLVLPVTEKLNLVEPAKRALPRTMDLRAGFPPVIDQGPTNGCSACATAALSEYNTWLTTGKYTRRSALFLYKVARNLMRAVGDSGSHLRTCMKALTIVGVCPEEYWPYDPCFVTVEPPAFCYAIANKFAALKYYRLDTPSETPQMLLDSIKAHLASKAPLMFGTFLSNDFAQSSVSGMIPYLMPWDQVTRSHAMVAAGYDDDLVIRGIYPQFGFTAQTQGALLVRNTWGPTWGDLGYGWLPYEYVLRGLTKDWWCLISSDWIDLSVFEADAETKPPAPPTGGSTPDEKDSATDRRE